ncbi:hypothetical protein ACUXCC_005259 [Cytobacillus horneckiae]|uniref:hypothetical protein n=1 Tax=Cytobacillus horneckiae TaxID=549687 RepID=UPI0019CFEC58|nr:hypothetical protein [Cytobacillus horneckiae]MBN6889809.1 hypothetical protein [Cytobacillus horneckiae]
MSNATIEDLKFKLYEEQLKFVSQRAFEQGVEYARSKYSYPPNMRKDHLAHYFQCSKATVENIIRMEGFPKSKVVTARYPRDLVIEWDEKNTERVNYLKGIR